MAKKYGWKPNRPISDIAKSTELEQVLMGLARPVYDAASRDPNPEYVASLQLRAFRSGGRRGRVSANVTASPVLGSAVEAKRGTLGRAIGNAGA